MSTLSGMLEMLFESGELRDVTTRQTIITHLETLTAQAKAGAPLESVAGGALAICVTAYICKKYPESEFLKAATEAFQWMKPQLEDVYKMANV